MRVDLTIPDVNTVCFWGWAMQTKNSYKKTLSMVLTSIMLILFLPVLASCEVLYVCENGCNYSKINDAIFNASEGNTVFVYNGTYYENVIVNKTINLVGENAFIDGNKTGCVLLVSSGGVNVSGFTITNSGSEEFDAGIEASSYVNISYNTMTNNNIGILVKNPVYLSYNKIFNNTGYGVYSNVFANATLNYWGSETGPSHASNPEGFGDNVSDNVYFDPWFIDAEFTTLSSIVSNESSNETGNETEESNQTESDLTVNITLESAEPDGNTKINIYDSEGFLVSESQGKLSDALNQSKSYKIILVTPLLSGSQEVRLENVNISQNASIKFQVIESYSGHLPLGITKVTPIYVQKESNVAYDYATIYLPKTGFHISYILHCIYWDFENENCLYWETGTREYYNMQENSTHIWFNVTEFDGYGGGGVWLSVNLNTPPDNTIVPQYRNFTVNATVTCMNGTCGEIYGTVRYNSSLTGTDMNISTTPGDEPFFTFDQNPQSCGNMNESNNCTLTWIVNSTGSLGSYYKVGVLFGNGTDSNQTQNNTVEIGKVLLINLTYDTIDFGTLKPGEGEKSALNNSYEYYNISIDKNSNNLDYLWIKGTDLIGETWPNYKIVAGNITWSFTNNPFTGSVIGYEYSLMDTDVQSGQNKTMYFWADVPYSLMSQTYVGELTIKANASWS